MSGPATASSPGRPAFPSPDAAAFPSPDAAAQRLPGPRERLLVKAIGYFIEHGVVDTSMRTLAAGIGTSNRMLNYHFGSREKLLAAIIEAVCAAESLALTTFVADADDPLEAGTRYWLHVAETSRTFAPLFYELASHAMYGKDYAERLREILITGWLDGFTTTYAISVPINHARRLARLSLAVGRGVLFDLALTGDRPVADDTIELFTEMVRRDLAESRADSTATDVTTCDAP